MAAPILVDYDPRWPERFRQLEMGIRSVLGEDVLRVDHIGSTSVSALAAKDVIDIQVSVASLVVADGWPDQIGPFQRRRDIGNDHVPPGESPGADWTKHYWSSRDPAAHMHVRELGRSNQRYPLLFRDFLRAESLAESPSRRAVRGDDARAAPPTGLLLPGDHGAAV